jgi:hypothetical protein
MTEYEIINARLRDAMTALPRPVTAKAMADASFDVLRTLASEFGQSPDSEVSIRKPGEARHFDDQTCYCVAWEAGPYEWAVDATMSAVFPKLVEPYYSFDLCFYPSED